MTAEELAGRKRLGDPVFVDREGHLIGAEPGRSVADASPEPARAEGDGSESGSGDGAGGSQEPAPARDVGEPGQRHESRGIPARVRRLVRARERGICAVGGCQRPGTTFHHRNRYGIERRHDAQEIFLICERHHAVVHAGAVENEGDDPKVWKITVAGRRPERTDARVQAIDARVQEHRMGLVASQANAP